MTPAAASWGRGNEITVERVTVPDRQNLLPQEIARFTQRGVYDETQSHLSFLQGGGHGGSHPHMVHEFVSSIVEERQPWPRRAYNGRLDRRRHLRPRFRDERWGAYRDPAIQPLALRLDSHTISQNKHLCKACPLLADWRAPEAK